MWPTIKLEALFASLFIDAHEGRSVHTFDVLGLYLHTSLSGDKVVHMKSEDEFVDNMCKVNPEYEKFVIYEKGKKVMYVVILKAIYGMIESALYGMICSLQHYRIWGSNLTHMKDALQKKWSMNTNAPSDGLWMTTRSHTWMTMFTQ